MQRNCLSLVRNKLPYSIIILYVCNIINLVCHLYNLPSDVLMSLNYVCIYIVIKYIAALLFNILVHKLEQTFSYEDLLILQLVIGDTVHHLKSRVKYSVNFGTHRDD